MLRCPLVVLFTSAIALLNSPASAQIVPDDSLGSERSSLQRDVLVNGQRADQIQGGAQRDSNLFHSFEQFNVGDGQRVYFAAPDGIDRILARVTGGRSRIDGTLGASGTADLFLLNPNGIVFGQNARLDVGGSFVASTAEAIAFPNQFSFSAVDPQSPPLLTVSAPIGLQFGNRGDRIQVQGSRLELAQGETLALIGGAVNVEAADFQVPGGRVELGGISEAGTVALTAGNRVRFPAALLRDNVSIANSTMNVRSNGGGSITIQAGAIEILGETNLTTGIEAGAEVSGRRSGNIVIRATGAVDISGASLIASDIQQGAIGNAGDIVITARSLRARNGAQISASVGRGTLPDEEIIGVNGRGNGGNVIIRVTDVASFGQGTDDSPTAVYSIVDRNSIGRGGSITIQADQVQVTDGAQLASLTRGQGDAGDLTITARDRVVVDGSFSLLLSRVNTGAIGQGGDITIRTGSLSVTNGAQLSASLRGGEGNAGDISIAARDRITMDGVDQTGSSSGIFSRTSAGTIGQGGNITLQTGTLSVTNGAFLVTEARGQGDAGNLRITARDRVAFDGADRAGNPSAAVSGVNETATGGSDGGDIIITTGTLSLTNGAELSAATNGEGNAGDVVVSAGDRILVTGSRLQDTDNNNQAEEIPSRMLAAVGSEAIGNGGDIILMTPALALNGGALTANTEGEGVAGNIFIRDANSVSLRNGSIETALTAGTAQAGGNITIQTNTLSLEDRSQISAETVRNRGGSITITDANSLLLRQGSRISTSAGTARAGGNGGNVAIDSTFIVTVPNENSDITANAFTGRGGNINIRTQGLFGITNQPQENSQTNDITASSQFGVDGRVSIDQPDVDPTEGTLELPTTFAAPPLAQGCAAPQDRSRFVNTGRGGLPANPADPLVAEELWQDLGESEAEGAIDPIPVSRDQSQPILTEAQGWIVSPEGNVILTAAAPTATPYGIGSLAGCARE